MSFLDRISIKNKLVLIILSVTIFSSTIGFALLSVNEYRILKDEMEHNLTLNAQLIGEYCLSTLIFPDPEGAEDVLQKLSAIPHVLEGSVYDTSGNMFATFTSDNYNPPLSGSDIRYLRFQPEDQKSAGNGTADSGKKNSCFPVDIFFHQMP